MLDLALHNHLTFCCLCGGFWGLYLNLLEVFYLKIKSVTPGCVMMTLFALRRKGCTLFWCQLQIVCFEGKGLVKEVKSVSLGGMQNVLVGLPKHKDNLVMVSNPHYYYNIIPISGILEVKIYADFITVFERFSAKKYQAPKAQKQKILDIKVSNPHYSPQRPHTI